MNNPVIASGGARIKPCGLRCGGSRMATERAIFWEIGTFSENFWKISEFAPHINKRSQIRRRRSPSTHGRLQPCRNESKRRSKDASGDIGENGAIARRSSEFATRTTADHLTVVERGVQSLRPSQPSSIKGQACCPRPGGRRSTSGSSDATQPPRRSWRKMRSACFARTSSAPSRGWATGTASRMPPSGRLSRIWALPVLGANWTGDRAGVPPLGGIDPEMPPKGGTPAAVLPRSHLKPEEPVFEAP